MIAPLFKENAALAPLPQRIMIHLNRYKASFVLAMAKALIPRAAEDLPKAIADIEDAISDLFDRGMVDRFGGESFLAEQVVFLSGSQFRFSDVATVWYCVMGETRCHVLKYEELKPLCYSEQIPLPFHNLKHAMTSCHGNAVLTRLYHCKADRKGAKEQIKKHLAAKSKGFKHWIKEGSYRLAVLVTSDGRKSDIEQLLSETFRTSPSLSNSAGVTVSVVPTEETFELMARGAV